MIDKKKLKESGLVFDSRSCPGSVAVKKDNVLLGMIITSANCGSEQNIVNKSDRFFLNVRHPDTVDIFSEIKPGNYQEVKKQIIDIVIEKSNQSSVL